MMEFLAVVSQHMGTRDGTLVLGKDYKHSYTQPQKHFLLKLSLLGAGEMAQHLGACTALALGPCLVLSTYVC